MDRGRIDRWLTVWSSHTRRVGGAGRLRVVLPLVPGFPLVGGVLVIVEGL